MSRGIRPSVVTEAEPVMADVVASRVSVRDLKTNPLQKAIDAGLISWSGQKPVFPPPIKLSGKGKLISEIVIEDRG